MHRHTASLASLLAVLFAVPTALAHDPIRAEFTSEDGVKLVGEYWTPIRNRDSGSRARNVAIALTIVAIDVTGAIT